MHAMRDTLSTLSLALHFCLGLLIVQPTVSVLIVTLIVYYTIITV